jgi:hypothetical protein
MSGAFRENTLAKLSHPVILSEAKDLCTFRAVGSSPFDRVLRCLTVFGRTRERSCAIVSS